MARGLAGGSMAGMIGWSGWTAQAGTVGGFFLIASFFIILNLANYGGAN
jgi:hypothetical protein